MDDGWAGGRVMDITNMLARLEGVYRSGDGWMATCPAHRDRSQSLSVGVGRDGRVLLWCHAGCETREVMAALGLTLRDLFSQS